MTTNGVDEPNDNLSDRLAPLKAQAQTLPHLPGCYRYFDKDHRCLYVGKARDLFNRVRSYFASKSTLSPRIRHMVSQIAYMETTVTRNEAEALLLENNLIKTLHPKYNIVFRDDKSYPYVRLSRDTFARMSYYRGGIDDKHDYYGPFPNAQAVREALNFMQKVFLLRTCEDSVFAHRDRPCLLGQIKRCSAPCVGLISEDDYHADVTHAKSFLMGKTQGLIEELEKNMWKASEDWAFEKAASLRDQIAHLRTVQSQQVMDQAHKEEDLDVMVVLQRNGIAVVNVAMIRHGRHLGDRAFFPQINHDDPPTDLEVLDAFLSQHYDDLPCPPTVIVGAQVAPEAWSEAVDLWKTVLKTPTGKPITWLYEPRGVRKTWLELCNANAHVALTRHEEDARHQRDRLDDLFEALGLEVPDDEIDQFRIECFDISHTHGEATQASCVVFENQAMQGKLYRRFNIDGIAGGDDYAAMRQVLKRRYQPVARGEALLPNLVLIDGGRGQVDAAAAVFEEMGLDTNVLVGVAKGEGRKVGLETLVYPKIEGVRKDSLELGPTRPALMLIASIRDEAHRFAITGMRAKRAKTRQTSHLEDLEGIGPKRRAKLLSHFGGMKQLKNASLDDIARVEGISHALATKVYNQLHPLHTQDHELYE